MGNSTPGKYHLYMGVHFAASPYDPAYQIPIEIGTGGKRTIELTGRRWYWLARFLQFVFRNYLPEL